MRLVLFTDIHGSESALASVLEKARAADAIVFAGDINTIEGSVEKLLRGLSRAGKPCIVVHGNHDSLEEIKAVCGKYPPLLFLHQGVYEHEGVTFVGHGGGGFARKDEAFERFWEKFLRGELKKAEKVVFVTHAPPYGTKVDSLYGEFRGNESYRRFIEEQHPVLHVCGHFHENFGKEDFIGPTRVINPGPRGVLTEI